MRTPADASWTTILGVSTPAVLGHVVEAEDAGAACRGRAADYAGLIERLASSTMTGDGFSGLAADSLVAVVAGLAEQLEPIVAVCEAAAVAFEDLASTLSDLHVRDDAALRLAQERWRQLREAEAAVDEARRATERARSRLRQTQATAVESEYAVALEHLLGAERALQGAEAALEAAEGELDASRRSYQDLRAEEELANSLASNRLRVALAEMATPWSAVECRLDSAVAAARADIVWSRLREVFLDHGYDVALPDPEQGRPIQYVSVDERGVQTVWVGGPLGGEFVVGRDISPGVFCVVVALLNGRLPEHRTFGHISELNAAEVAAVQWAYATNFAEDEAGQLHMAGVNGEWDRFCSGGDYTPQGIHAVNTVGLALAITPGAGAATIAQRVNQVAGPLGAGAGMSSTRAPSSRSRAIRKVMSAAAAFHHPPAATGFDPEENRPARSSPVGRMARAVELERARRDPDAPLPGGHA